MAERVSAGFRVSSVSVGYDLSGPKDGRLGEEESKLWSGG